MIFKNRLIFDCFQSVYLIIQYLEIISINQRKNLLFICCQYMIPIQVFQKEKM